MFKKSEEKKEDIFKEDTGKKRKKSVISFFLTILRSMNPDAYHKLMQRNMKDSWKYFFTLLFFAFIVAAIIIIPSLIRLPSDLNKEFAKIDIFKLNPEIKTSGTIEFPALGLIIDSSKKNLSYENFLISSDDIVQRPLLCRISKSLCLLYPKDKRIERINMTDYTDLVAHKKEAANILTALVVMLLPVVLALLFVFYSIKYLFIIIFVASIAYIALSFTKHHMAWKALFKLGLYASTIMILLEVISLPIIAVDFLLTFYIPLILFVLFFTIGLLIVGGQISDEN